MKILYVDDEFINLEIFEINFSEKYEVFTALDAKSGLEVLAKESGIVVVISDMRMPEMNGIDFIKIAKSQFPDKKSKLCP